MGNKVDASFTFCRVFELMFQFCIHEPKKIQYNLTTFTLFLITTGKQAI